MFTCLIKRKNFSGENSVKAIERPGEDLEKLQKIIFTLEEKNIIYTKGNSWKRALAAIGFEFGMRKMEMLSMEKSRIRIDTREIEFDSFKQSERRRMPMNDICYSIIEPYYRELPANTKWLFPNRSDPKQHLTSVYEEWKNFLNELGLPYKPIKLMRDTFITHGLEDGIPRAIIKLYTGHKSESVFNSYSHIGQDYDRVRRYINREIK